MNKKFLCVSSVLFFLCAFFTFSPVFAESSPKLLFAIDLIRHGDRTPVHAIPNSPYPWKGGLGELTTLGKKQEFNLGCELRQHYINQYHLLPSRYNSDSGKIYVRSTKMNRTMQSAESLLLGLYPLDSRVESTILTSPTSIYIHTVEKKEDHLLAPYTSKNIFSKITLYLYTRAAWKEKTAGMQDKIQYWSKATGLPLDNFEQILFLADNLYIRKLHHVPLPRGINNQDADAIISLGQWAMVTAFKRKEISYPMGHEFLKTVVADMNQAVEGKSDLKYILFSAHDSSIMSVMSALGTPLDKPPRYASHLNFSLFGNNGQYYVKISMNNKPVAVPGCDKDQCLLSTFSSLISKKFLE